MICVYIYIYVYICCRFHGRVLLPFQQPTFQNHATYQCLFSCTCSAAHVFIYVVSSEIMKCRLLK